MTIKVTQVLSVSGHVPPVWLGYTALSKARDNNSAHNTSRTVRCAQGHLTRVHGFDEHTVGEHYYMKTIGEPFVRPLT